MKAALYKLKSTVSNDKVAVLGKPVVSNGVKQNGGVNGVGKVKVKKPMQKIDLMRRHSDEEVERQRVELLRNKGIRNWNQQD